MKAPNMLTAKQAFELWYDGQRVEYFNGQYWCELPPLVNARLFHRYKAWRKSMSLCH